jgi:hypothetical protein
MGRAIKELFGSIAGFLREHGYEPGPDGKCPNARPGPACGICRKPFEPGEGVTRLRAERMRTSNPQNASAMTFGTGRTLEICNACATRPLLEILRENGIPEP